MVVATLPFCKFSVTTCKLKPYGYPMPAKTIGERLRALRMDQGLTQSCMAKKLGCSPHTLRKWEKNIISPIAKNDYQLAEVLGQNLFEKSSKIREEIKRFRREKGWSRRRLSEEMGIHPNSIYKWEKGLSFPPDDFVGKIEAYLGGEKF